jgi:hypothetical protein
MDLISLAIIAALHVSACAACGLIRYALPSLALIAALYCVACLALSV